MLDYNELKYITAPTFTKCEEMLRERYGKYYVVKSIKDIKQGGFLGIGQKDAVEVAFVVVKESQSQTPLYNSPYFQASTTGLTNISKINTAQDTFQAEKEKILADKKLSNPQLQELLSELKELRSDISGLQNSSIMVVNDDEHDTINKIRTLLEQNEFTSSYIKKILEKIKKEFTIEQLNDFDTVQNQVVIWIGESIQIADTRLRGRPEIIILVGPTGVGKTTTVAKIAAKYGPVSSGRSLNVQLINADNYRIGGKQQLETYASLLTMQMDSIDHDGDFVEKLNSCSVDTDVIIVDTFGCSPKDYEKIAVLRKRLDAKGTKAQVYLAMTASSKPSDMKEILQQFEVFSYSSVIVTKLDETNCVGNLISVLDEKNKEIAYITTGQSVPNDIEKASVLTLLNSLNGFKIDQEQIKERFTTENTL